MNYYLLNKRKERKGPYTEEALRRYWEVGKIPAGTLCCTKGMDIWKPIEEFGNIIQEGELPEANPELAEEPQVQQQPKSWLKPILACLAVLIVGGVGFLIFLLTGKGSNDPVQVTGSATGQVTGSATGHVTDNDTGLPIIPIVDNNCSRLAVTPPGYDDMGKLLEQLGKGYKYDKITERDLLYPGKISKYDVIFITCAFSKTPAPTALPTSLQFSFSFGDGGQKDIQGYHGKNATILLNAFGTPHSTQATGVDALWIYRGLDITDTNGTKFSSVKFTVSGGEVKKVEVISDKEEINVDLRQVSINESLRGYVNNGGIIYASDLRFPLLQAAFREHIDATLVNSTGRVQQIEAEVIDPSLQDFLEAKSVPINFNAGGWRLAAFKGESVKVLLKGSVSLSSGKTVSTPLMVKFQAGKGYVIFTSFHNAAQKSELESKLLKYLVFNSITSGVNVEIAEQLTPKGMKIRMGQLISFASAGQSSNQSFICRKSGEVVFSVGFQCRGAKFKLIASGPDGKKLEKEGSHSFFISGPQAKEGDKWELEVVATSVPHDNFPVRLGAWQ
jgi:hypothetical protein